MRLLALAFAGVEGGLGAAVDVPSASVGMPSTSVDAPSVDLSVKTPDVPSVGGDVSGDLPSVDAKLTGPNVDVEGGGASLGAGLAAGVTAAVGAGVAGLGLSGKADKPEGEVRLFIFLDCGGGCSMLACWLYCFSFLCFAVELRSTESSAIIAKTSFFAC